jgi:hypothetical protein
MFIGCYGICGGSGSAPPWVGESNGKRRRRSLRDDSQKSNGNSNSNSKGNSNSQYRGLSTALRFGRDDGVWGCG